MGGIALGEFPQAISSFRYPTNPPPGDPDGGVLVSFCFNRDYKPYLLGAMSQLLLETTWRGGFEAKAAVIAKMNRFMVVANDTDYCGLGSAGVGTYDFSAGTQGWEAQEGFGSHYASGVGFYGEWQSEGGLDWVYSAYLERTLSTPVFPHILRADYTISNNELDPVIMGFYVRATNEVDGTGLDSVVANAQWNDHGSGSNDTDGSSSVTVKHCRKPCTKLQFGMVAHYIGFGTSHPDFDVYLTQVLFDFFYPPA